MTDEQQQKDTAKEAIESPGQTLKAARAKVGLSLPEVAEKLFLKVTAIEALEEDKIDESKSVTFTKGYVRNYARLVGLDASQMVEQFELFHKKPEDAAKLQSFSKRVAKQAHDDRWMMVTYFLLVLLIGAVVLWWYQQPNSMLGEALTGFAETEQTTNQTESNSTPEPTVSVQTAPPALDVDETNLPDVIDSVAQDDEIGVLGEENSETEDAELSANLGTNLDDTNLSNEDSETDLLAVTETDSDDALAVQGDDSTPVLDDAPEIDSITDTEDTPTQADIIAQDDTNAQDETTDGEQTATLVFTFAEDCWVNVSDATGEAIAYGVKAAGRIMELQGLPPFEVTLGAPNVVQITYNGEDVDMSGFSGREIGRLTLPIQE